LALHFFRLFFFGSTTLLTGMMGIWLHLTRWFWTLVGWNKSTWWNGTLHTACTSWWNLLVHIIFFYILAFVYPRFETLYCSKTGTDVMITFFCDLANSRQKKLSAFSKIYSMINFL
jgi:hypothetical protein